MNLRFLAIILLGFFAYMISESLAVLLIFLLLYGIGIVVLKLFNQDKRGLNIFVISFGTFFTYALLLFIYMAANSYDYLQSFDGFNVYIPYTKELLDSESFFGLIETIYNSSKYAFVGAILVPFVYIGKLSILLGGELYLPLQLVVIFFAALTSVMVYNILVYKNIEATKAFNYTLLYSLVSVHFLMSTYIVRDMPITLFFTILIYLSFKPFSLKNILIMLLLVLAIMSIRLSSGIFASIYILLVIMMADKRKNEIKKVGSHLLLVGAVLSVFIFINDIIATFELKQEQYLAIEKEDQDGASTLTTFNVLPPGLSHLTKATYNQFMPIPSWRTMIKTAFRPESYNIMNFPVITSTFFRYVMWAVIIIGFLNKRLRNLIKNDKVLFFNFLIAILFIMIQSSTMGHRRMLGVYPVFFLVAIMFYQAYGAKAKRTVLGIPMVLFLTLQLFGAFYLI